MNKFVVVHTLTIAALLAGCGELPQPQSTLGDAAGDPAAQQEQNPQQVVPDNAPAPAAPVLVGLPERYGYATVPVRGQAAPYLDIMVTGGLSPIATEADSTGNFCVDVPLQSQSVQTLEVIAQDSRGELSDATSVTLTHDPNLAESYLPVQPLIELATGGTIYADITPELGELTALNDGDPTTSTLFAESVVWLDLGAFYDVESIEILFADAAGSGDAYATEYALIASSVAAPTLPPAWDSAGWDLLYYVNPDEVQVVGDGGSEMFDLITPMRARYIGVQLWSDANWDLLFTDEDFRIAEISVKGRSIDELAPIDLTPTCENGGTP